MKLFRQVKRRERRPKKNDTYPTSRGDCLYHVNFGFVDDLGMRINPEYWYEPVEIPTDEEIEQMKYEKYGTDKFLYGAQRDGYKEGFKAAIKHLTGGNNHEKTNG